MVTLPELDSYKDSEKENLFSFSPILSHYLNLSKKSPTSFSDEIRILKHKGWLKCALATLKGDHTPEEVCHFWSDYTDKIIQKTWKECGLDKKNICVMGLGKLGSKELNLSSDVDLVIVKSDDETLPDTNTQIKKFLRLLTEQTHMGFAYRVDLNLRPGGGASPLVPSLSHFYNYYDLYLEGWNRLAFIRMRPICGEKTLTNEIQEYCKRLAFPRRLDFSVIKEIKSIRSKLEFQWRKASEPFDIKLHPGGIRDIELYIHALQVIYGGREVEIQTANITLAMKELKNIGKLPAEQHEQLVDFYWSLRQLENHIHLFEDQHTYLYTGEVLRKLQNQFPEKELKIKLANSERICSEFFTEEELSEGDDALSSEIAVDSKKMIDEILSLQTHSFKKVEHQKIKKRILNKYLESTQRIAVDPDLAISTFRDFIFAIRSKSSIFFLLNRHEELLENLAWLFSVSPYVGQVLCRRPELMDSFALGSVAFSDNDDTETLLENLIDYKLLGQLISIIYLFKNKDIDGYTQQLSNHADFIVGKLLDHLDISDKVKVLTMGKWSGKELGAQSDLDFVLITDTSPTPEVLKKTRRFINLITTNTSAGKLYNIDLRLKPNESAGPLLIEKSQLFDFIKTKADPWQKQAYLRSRLAQSDQLYFRDHFDLLELRESDLDSLNEIREKLLTMGSEKSIDIKNVYGGLIDSEFRLQIQCLLQGLPPQSPSTLDIHTSLNLKDQKIIKNYQQLRFFEQVFQMCNSSPSTKVGVTNQNLERLSKLMDIEAPFEWLKEVTERQTVALNSLT